MDVSLVIKQRLSELGLDQRDLATATQVTESYVSQLLTRKKAPPAPGRTDIYGRQDGQVSQTARWRNSRGWPKVPSATKRSRNASSNPLSPFSANAATWCCASASPSAIWRSSHMLRRTASEIPNNEELLDVAQAVAKEELRSETWLRSMAQVSGRSYEQMRVATLEFLDTDVFNVSVENCVSFLDPIVDSWDLELKTFAMEVALVPPVPAASGGQFVEQQPTNQHRTRPR